MYLPDGLGTDLLPRLGGDVIVITAAADSATVRRALGAGAVNYLVKPFGAVELADRLRAYAKYHRHVRGEGTSTRSRSTGQSGCCARATARRRRPQGPLAATATLVLQCLQRADGAVSAADVAGRAGLSRATAQRYLADLAATAAPSHPALRHTGRPEHRYVVRGR